MPRRRDSGLAVIRELIVDATAIDAFSVPVKDHGFGGLFDGAKLDQHLVGIADRGDLMVVVLEMRANFFGPFVRVSIHKPKGNSFFAVCVVKTAHRASVSIYDRTLRTNENE